MPLRTESPRRRLRALVAGSTLLLAATLLPGGTAAADPSPSAPGQAVAESKQEAHALQVLEEAQDALDPAAGEEVKDATIALRDLRLALDELPAEERAVARELLAPSGSRTASRAGCVSRKRGLFEVQVCAPPKGYTVEDVLDAFDNAQERFTALGYRPTPADADGFYNVYISDLGPNLFGKTVPTSQRRVATSYIEINSDLTWWTRNTPLETMAVTAAHEYFHAVQFGYDSYEDAWLMEATATWAEDEVPTTDVIDDNRTYLAWSPIRRPLHPMARFDGLYPYGSWIFFRYLTDRFRDPSIVRAIWNRAVGTQYSLPAIDGALRARDTDLAHVFAQFSDANRRPAQVYSEGRAYRAKGLRDQRVFRRVGAGQTFTTPRLNQLTSVTYRFDSRRLGAAAGLRLAIDMPETVTGSRAVVTTYRTSGAVRSQVVRLSAAGNRTLRAAFGSRDVRAVEVTLVNASRRMAGCSPDFFGEWPCSGVPRDTGKVSTVRAVVVRR